MSSSAPFPFVKESLPNVTSFPFTSLPVRESFAPGISFPPVDCLLISTVVLYASSTITIRLLSSVTALSPIFTSFPLSIMNSISVATLYPLGSASSCKVYTPLGRSFIVDLSVPDVHTSIVSVVESMSSEAPSPFTKDSALISIALPVALSLPVRVSFAPGISSPPVDCLLISTVVFAIAASTITITLPSVLGVAPLTLVTLPPSITNSISVATSKPLGAVTSCKV